MSSFDPIPLATPVERRAALTIGTVDSVAPGNIVVRLELDAPQTTALNTGSPVAFPRLNGFVVVPHESGALVGIVVWLGVEHSSYPKRPGLKDFGLVDLPFPVRKMSVVPVGTLEQRGNAILLRRGVVAFPSVGDPVALPSAEQLDALTRGEPADRRVHIGRALLGNDAEIRVDPDKLFGRHLAVLGNTGSGKSCSVAGLIRWSLDAARDASGAEPNSRFLVLDPNGEYREALGDLPGFRIFQVPPLETPGATELRVPAWLFNSHEWASVTYASTRMQRPVLVYGLRHLRTGGTPELGREQRLARLARAHVALIDALRASPKSYTQFPGDKGFGKGLQAFAEGLEGYRDITTAGDQLDETISTIESIVDSRLENGKYWSAFSEADLDELTDSLAKLIDALPATGEVALGNEDLPIRFDTEMLADQLDAVVSFGDFDEAARYLGGLKLRVRALLADERLRPVLRPDIEPSLEEWLGDFLGDGSGSSVAVVDLSLVPADVVEVVVAVLARMVFEALQRHRRIERKALPTTIVLEEAHVFVRRHDALGEFETPGQMCVRTFERIAREGRKFGLGMILSSQRPSELSPTILAQCNSFLLHRLVNDRDQGLVAKLVPDNLSGLLEDLPSLPARHALLLGWATPLPTLFEVRELPLAQRPQSADPDFWTFGRERGSRTSIGEPSPSNGLARSRTSVTSQKTNRRDPVHRNQVEMAFEARAFPAPIPWMTVVARPVHSNPMKVAQS
jgi:DNA helicase HerA-like ATPase